MATRRGSLYCPLAASTATLSFMLLMRRCPVRSYSIHMPTRKRPDPSRLMIMYLTAATSVLPICLIMIRPQAERVFISTKT